MRPCLKTYRGEHMKVIANIHIQATLTSQEYKDLINSVDRVYAFYLLHLPHNLESVAPLLAFKNALVLSAQEVAQV